MQSRLSHALVLRAAVFGLALPFPGQAQVTPPARSPRAVAKAVDLEYEAHAQVVVQENAQVVRQEAYVVAAKCYTDWYHKPAPLPLDSISWTVVPGDSLHVPVRGGRTVAILAVGDDVGRRVWISEKGAEVIQVMAHEILHVFGVKGTREHPNIFRACKLMPEQLMGTGSGL